MKTYIGIEDRQVRVRCETQYGETFCVSVRDILTGYDVRPYLDQDVLDRLTQDWMLNEQAEAIQDVSRD